MPAEDPLRAAFDAETFRAVGHRVVDRLADYVRDAQAGPGPEAMPVLPWREPAEGAAEWTALLDRPAELIELLGRYLDEGNHLHHPRYAGHQVGVPMPAAALAYFTTMLTNNAEAVYEMSPVGVAMERACIGWLAARLGWGPEADGILTSGGSLGNLTGLLAARQATAGFDVWSEGEAGGQPLAVLVGAESHYSVARALQVMGIGRRGAVRVPVDAAFRLDPSALAPAFRETVAAGRKPIAVVASSCSTATGAFDPLEPIADFCGEHELWLHVDGAHGAPAALSAKYRHLLAGIERADSVVWDAHKMMMIPALCTAVLYRDGRRSYEAFAQEASYLLHRGDPRDEWYNLCSRTLECTKPTMSLPLYVAIATAGAVVFEQYVTSRFDLGRRFGEMLAETDDFRIPAMPQCNIVCFRYEPPGTAPERLDALQPAIRRGIIDSGDFYLVQARIHGDWYLRVALMNPFTTEADLAALLARVREAGRSILAS